jgi:sporulation protein YlmC with PRC-barrel domain
MNEATSITSGNLIAADKVDGTNVYNLAGEKLGTVEDVMIDKISGRAVYAVMSFGGFLGMGEKHHPLPWTTLKYDAQKGGYMINMDKKLLQNAPTYDMNSEFKWTPEYGRKVDSYYKAPSNWN